jgi:hypothetical protein
MERLLRFAIFILCIFSAGKTFGACHAVTPSGSGSQTGSNWSNAYAGLPATLIRGDIYYLADGNYPAYNFNTADSGTTTIEIRKAQSYDFGSTGCGTSIGAGWSTSTMGSAQAIFSSGSHAWLSSKDYLIVNGNGRSTTAPCGEGPGSTVASKPATPSDCGISFVGTGTATNVISFFPNPGVATNQTFKYFELMGSGTNDSGGMGDLEIFGFNGSTNTVIQYAYMHNSGCVYIQDLGSNTTVDHTYFWGTEVNGGSACHGQAEYEVGGNNNGVRSNNVYRDITGTAVWTFGTSGTNNNWVFYNNVVFFSSPQLSFGGLTDGALACINSNTCTNFVYNQNTTVNCLSAGVFGPSQCGLGFGDSTAGSSVTIENNLYYSNPGSIALTTNNTTVVSDYNSFLNSPNFGSGAHDVRVASGSPNPFTNWPGSNFSLASDNADWNNRLALSAPYTTSASGSPFTTDRGAFQFGAASTPNPPTNLSATAH